MGVALLNGYGSAVEQSDVEDHRRKGKMRKLSRNMFLLTKENSFDIQLQKAGVGNSLLAVWSRIQLELHRRVESPKASSTSPSLATALAIEYTRFMSLRRGGGEAARILANEDTLSQSILQKFRNDEKNDGTPTSPRTTAVLFSEIKPGVSCIVLSNYFSRSIRIHIHELHAYNLCRKHVFLPTLLA